MAFMLTKFRYVVYINSFHFKDCIDLFERYSDLWARVVGIFRPLVHFPNTQWPGLLPGW